MFHSKIFWSSLLSEYPLSLLANYLMMAANIIAQIVLVPIYLANLGAEGFGVLVLILGLINYTAIGVGWLSGGLQRILGETFATSDSAGFVRAYDLGKILFVAYALLALLTGLGLTLIAALIGNPDNLSSFVANIAPALAGGTLYAENQSLPAWVARLIAPDTNLNDITRTLGALRWLTPVIIAAGVGSISAQ